ncbi:MAG: glycosyltransferase family 9 protein [Planctomycetota bacterium]
MKETLSLGGVDMLGHAEYIEFLPGRSCIDRIISIDSLDMHRLFADRKGFDVGDRDPLVSAFGGYAWIATFLGERDSDFEDNLIYTANCSGSTEVVTLALKPPAEFSGHVTSFYTTEFLTQSGLSAVPEEKDGRCLIEATRADSARGKILLREAGLDSEERPIVIHPGSGGLDKCWHLDNFLGVAQRLKSEGLQVLFLLGPAELDRYSKPVVEQIGGQASFFAELPLRDVLSLLSCAKAFVGNDSGITHLAAGLGIRTFALFGPTNPAHYGPIGPEVTILRNDPEVFAKKASIESQKELLEAILA